MRTPLTKQDLANLQEDIHFIELGTSWVVKEARGMDPIKVVGPAGLELHLTNPNIPRAEIAQTLVNLFNAAPAILQELEQSRVEVDYWRTKLGETIKN